MNLDLAVERLKIEDGRMIYTESGFYVCSIAFPAPLAQDFAAELVRRWNDGGPCATGR
jgi:hypothetical protein